MTNEWICKFCNACMSFITLPTEGVARYCFHPVCLCVCVCVCVYLCVRPIFWYFISRLLRRYRSEIYTGYLYGCTQLTKINWPSKVKVTGTVYCFLKVQSYHKNWAIEKYNFFFIDNSLDTLFDETIKTGVSREMTSQKIRQYLTLTCKTPIPKLLFLIKSSTKI